MVDLLLHKINFVNNNMFAVACTEKLGFTMATKLKNKIEGIDIENITEVDAVNIFIVYELVFCVTCGSTDIDMILLNNLEDEVITNSLDVNVGRAILKLTSNIKSLITQFKSDIPITIDLVNSILLEDIN